MDAKQNLYELQMECFEIFKAQNPEDFDVIFEIDGKKMYADKYKLSKISTTFKSMLSELWTSKDESIKLENYSYEHFKEFLTFIYSGECFLDASNISTMIDISEFYGVKTFKKACDNYLSKMGYNFDNVFQFYELADKYSLTQSMESLNVFISNHFGLLIKTEQFQALSKSVMKNIVESNQKTPIKEEFFEAVFKWAEIRAVKKQELDGILSLNEAIKEELTDILPFFKFDEMHLDFLIKFVVKQSFLFTGDELSDILWVVRYKANVKIFDRNGKQMKGALNCPEIGKISDVIASLKNESINGSYWKTKQPKPSEPSKLIKNAGIDWYLVYDSDGDLAVKRQTEIDSSHYLLAEMFAEDGFILNGGCKVEIYRYF